MSVLSWRVEVEALALRIKHRGETKPLLFLGLIEGPVRGISGSRLGNPVY